MIVDLESFEIVSKRSAVVVSQVSSVEKARLGERIGSLSDTESG